ncbi:hypothetical protein Tco_0384706, partial [Tanacetum coccineum]
MRELEATGEHTTAEINAMVQGGKLRGHIPDVGGASGSCGSRARDSEGGEDVDDRGVRMVAMIR